MLYAGSVLWTIGYDTIYAHQDKEDDLMLGLKSTALKFGDSTPRWLGALYGGAVLLWSFAGFLAGAHLVFFSAMALVGAAARLADRRRSTSATRQLPAPLPFQPRRRRGAVPRADRRHGAVVDCAG